MSKTENAATAYLKKLRLFNRDVRLYLVSSALVGLAWIGIFTVIFNLYLLRLDYDLAFIGLVNACGMLAYALISLPAGAMGGRWGVRRMVILGYTLAAVGFLLLPLAEAVPAAWRSIWLLFTNSLGWLGASVYIVNADVFLMALTGEEERSYAYSIQVALWPLAAFAGSLIGGFLPRFFAGLSGVSLDGPAPYRSSILLAAALFSLGVPALLGTRKERKADTEPEEAPGLGPAKHAPYGLIVFLASVQLLQGTGEFAARTFFNIYLDVELDVATHTIGTLAALGQLVAVPAALATPLLLARWRNGPTFVRASLGITLSLLPLALIPHWAAAGFGFMGVMAMGSVWRPAFVLYRMGIVAPRWRALLNGAANMALGLSGAGMALGGAYIAKNLSFNVLFLIGAVLTATGALLFWVFCRTQHRERVYPKVAIG
jgi:predicted MFS family arabinose efflux permease